MGVEVARYQAVNLQNWLMTVTSNLYRCLRGSWPLHVHWLLVQLAAVMRMRTWCIKHIGDPDAMELVPTFGKAKGIRWLGPDHQSFTLPGPVSWSGTVNLAKKTVAIVVG